MFSGKTTELIKEYHRHIACGFTCCFVNHSLDEERYEVDNTVAHNTLKGRNYSFSKKNVRYCKIRK